MKKLCLVFITLLMTVAGCAPKGGPASDSLQSVTETGNPKLERRYTFSREYTSGSDMEPRGGTSTGAPVTLLTSPSPAYLSISEPGITKYEQDRRAILAMAGTYRTTFDFVETVPLRADYKKDRPYQSWATEVVEVVQDSGGFISLQHILVMYFVDKDGQTQGPFVSKHWRQDWKYEDTELLVYRGDNTWDKAPVQTDESRGKWSQAVYQVDDSPRYEALGDWDHRGNYSAWTSGEMRRPLPRREFSVRDDYNVLEGVNRHIVTPTGWVHEQDNVKLLVDENGEPSGDNPYLAKEVGLNRYERISHADYAAGDEYWESTGEYWGDVRDAWAKVIQDNDTLRLRSKYEGSKLYQYLFEYADAIEKIGSYDGDAGSKFAYETIGNFVITGEGKTDRSAY